MKQRIMPIVITRSEMDFRLAYRDRRLDSMEYDIKELKRDVKDLKSDVKELKSDVNTLKTDVKALSVRVDGLEKSMAAQFENVNKRIDDLGRSQEKNFHFMEILIAVVPLAIAIVQHFMK